MTHFGNARAVDADTAMSERASKKPRVGADASSPGGSGNQPQDDDLVASLRAQIAELQKEGDFLEDRLTRTNERLLQMQQGVGAGAGEAAIAAMMESDEGKRCAAALVAAAVGAGIKEHVSASGWDRTQPYPSLEEVQNYRDSAHLQAGRESPAWLFQVRNTLPHPISPRRPSSPSLPVTPPFLEKNENIPRSIRSHRVTLRRLSLSRLRLQAFLDGLFETTAPASAAIMGAEDDRRAARSARLKATMTDASYASASAHYTSIFGTLVGPA